ncbi:MAG: hypothetical protein AMS19_00325 [Gemmatimonas sp. SG8_23]|nr:MAG: hypothetical protein AMS19_00325 [Gemmatimonas sp. SG8_23]
MLAVAVAVGAGCPESTAAQVTGAIEVHVLAASPDGPADPSRAPSPLFGASVTARPSGYTASTDENGVAVLRGVPPGWHQLEVAAPGFETAAIDVAAENGRTAVVRVALTPTPIPLSGIDVSVGRDALPAGSVTVDVAELPADVVDVPSAVDALPGATVVRRGGPGAPAAVQLRGSGSDQVLVLLDGVPINAPVTGVADLGTLSLDALERITIVPGAQSSRYGPRALGGVVLLESRTADRTSAAMTAGAGSWSSRELTGNGSWVSSGPWGVSGSAQWSRSDGDFPYEVPAFRGGGEADRANAAHARIGAEASAVRKGVVDLTLRAHAMEIERGSPGTIAQPSLTGEQRERRIGSSLRATAGDPVRGASLFAAVQAQHAEYVDTAPPFGRAYEALTRVRVVETAGEGWWSRGALGVRGGIEASRMAIESDALASPTASVGELGVWSRLDLRPATRSRGRISAGAGIRVDAHELVDGVTTSPQITASYAYGETRVDASWSNAFSPPGVGDLFFQEGVLVEPNPELRPERVRNELSLSLRHRWTLDFGLAVEGRATAYRADVDDMIQWFPDFRFVWSPRNIDVSRRGIEVGSTFETTLWGRSHTLAVDFARSRVEYRDEALTGQLPYRPELTLDASLSLALSPGTLTASARHVGARRSVPGSELNELAAYTLLDLGVRLPLKLGVAGGALDLAVTNLLDERAALLVDYPLPGRGWTVRLRLNRNP